MKHRFIGDLTFPIILHKALHLGSVQKNANGFPISLNPEISAINFARSIYQEAL
jgi:hypothetical protein